MTSVWSRSDKVQDTQKTRRSSGSESAPGTKRRFNRVSCSHQKERETSEALLTELSQSIHVPVVGGAWQSFGDFGLLCRSHFRPKLVCAIQSTTILQRFLVAGRQLCKLFDANNRNGHAVYPVVAHALINQQWDQF